MMKLEQTDIYQAEYVLTQDNGLKEIKFKWGVGPGRALAPPSKGGFGVVCENGQTVTMWQAKLYFKRTNRWLHRG